MYNILIDIWYLYYIYSPFICFQYLLFPESSSIVLNTLYQFLCGFPLKVLLLFFSAVIVLINVFIILSKEINSSLIISKCFFLRNLTNYSIIFYNPMLHLRILMSLHFHSNYFEKRFFPRKLFYLFRMKYLRVSFQSSFINENESVQNRNDISICYFFDDSISLYCFFWNF